MAHSRLSQLVSHVDVKNATVSPVTETDELEKRDHASTYSILEKPLGTPRHIRIVGIGAGASGLNMIRTLRKKLTHYEFLIYEKNPQVGGTWFENRYPGCKCDIPSHNYQFSWRKNPEWTSFFSPAAEIEHYLCKLCEEERFYDSIRTSHIVSRAAWNEDKGIWELGIKNLQDETELEDYCHFLLDARGILHHAGKTVAVIGNGSSGIQIVAAIQPDVKQLVHFIRSPTWIAPPRIQTLMAGKTGEVMSKVELDEDGRFTTAQIHKFKKDPEFYMNFVKAVEEDVNGNFPIVSDLNDKEINRDRSTNIGLPDDQRWRSSYYGSQTFSRVYD
ncbi:hypothetical protein Plec18167_002516 [Paecilomyces lecythidis]|uniref:Uncharacterized protein n=1 Tax=Paecilomyces lecythidis TaxID=3004212 RepID=A0ABR3Y6S8_9EURO